MTTDPANNAVAPRFSLRLPMRYRPVGDTRWRSTITENLSSSGVRFGALEPLAVGAHLEIEISMTAAFLKPMRVIARSEVVRQVADNDLRVTAARHVDYRLEADDPNVEQFARTHGSACETDSERRLPK